METQIENPTVVDETELEGENLELDGSQNGHKDEEEEDEENEVMNLVALAPNRQLVKLPTEKNPKGERFEIHLLDDFGVEDQQQILSMQRRYQKLFNTEGRDLKDKEREHLKDLLDKIFNMILIAPAAVKGEMSDSIKGRVMAAFSMAPMLQQAKAQGQLLTSLIDKGYLTQEQIDETVKELEKELITES